MRKLWLIALLYPVMAHATATVTIVLTTPGQAIPPNSSVRVDLQNCKSPRVPGTTFIVPTSQTFVPTSGTVTATLYENAAITCSTTAGQSYYTFNFISNGATTSIGSYVIPAGSSTLSSLTPLAPLPSASNVTLLPQFVGIITTTASTADSLTVNGLTTSSHCIFVATSNPAGALVALGAYIAASTNSATVTHNNSQVGSTFDIWCKF